MPKLPINAPRELRPVLAGPSRKEQAMVKRVTALVILIPLVILALIWMHGNEQRLGDQTSEMICSLRPC